MNKPLFRKAKKSEIYLKCGMSGPSGSGKTMSALRLAYGLVGDWDKICVLDTENRSSELYCDTKYKNFHIGEFNTVEFDPPYEPQRFVSAIDSVVKDGIQCVIIDSSSHEWDGKGGCLQIHSNLGGRFQDWATVTPMHQEFLEKIKSVKAHVIPCLRRKQEHVMETVNGRAKVVKKGLKEIQRDGFEYELTLSFDIEMNHLVTASKDRTSLFVERPPFQITEATGQELIAWSKGEVVDAI